MVTAEHTGSPGLDSSKFETARLLHVIPTLNPAMGGPRETVSILAEYEASAGLPMEVLTFDSEDAPWLRDLPFTVHTAGPSYGNFAFAPAAGAWLRRAHRAYDAIVVRGVWQYHSAAVARVATQIGIPYFVFPHGMLDGWFKSAYPLKHVKKLIYWKLIERQSINSAAAVLFTSQEELENSIDVFPGFRGNPVVVPYGTRPPSVDELDRGRLLLHEKFPDLSNRRFLLFLGRVHEKKGVQYLCRALKEAAQESDLSLVIAGPDEQGMIPKVLEEVSASGLTGRVEWIGLVKPPLKWGLLQAAEALILPSHQENFGVVVAESLACGTPTLLSHNVNIWKQVQEGGCGIAAQASQEGTVELISRWERMSFSERQGYREKCRAFFDANYHIEAASRGLRDVVAQCTKVR